MIPIRDVIPTRTTPYVTLTSVALLAAALATTLGLLGPVPAAALISTGAVRHPLIGIANALGMWLFGENVEDRIGHGRFLVFLAVCGAVSALAMAALGERPGARLAIDGSIAGLMGGYLALYPRARVVTLVPIPLFVRTFEVPAVGLIALWLLLQLGSGAELAAAAGFGSGAAAVLAFRRPERQRVEWWNGLT